MARFTPLIALFCIFAVAYSQTTTEAAEEEVTTKAEEVTTKAAEPSTEGPSPAPTTSAPDVTTEPADDKYTAACKKQFADKENVTAIQGHLGPFSTCYYECAIVSQKIRRGVFELDVIEIIGKKTNVDDHSSCAPGMECLKGVCNIGQEVDDCLETNAETNSIESTKNPCKKSCVGKDGKEVAQINANEGVMCNSRPNKWIPFPGTCKSGSCQSMI